jgi:hypothetical protein
MVVRSDAFTALKANNWYFIAVTYEHPGKSPIFYIAATDAYLH